LVRSRWLRNVATTAGREEGWGPVWEGSADRLLECRDRRFDLEDRLGARVAPGSLSPADVRSATTVSPEPDLSCLAQRSLPGRPNKCTHRTLDDEQVSLNKKPAELRRFCRALYRTRTDDPFLTMEVLYQLS
jgi:hypothetical protein